MAEETQGVVENNVGANEKVDPAVASFVKLWTKKVKAAREHFERKGGPFARMRTCMQLAKDGADKEWVAADKYVVPILNRHINQAVAQLYAKNPQAYAKHKKRRMHTVWDGKLATLNEAAQSVKAFTMGQQQSAAAGQQGVAMPPPQPVDPQALAIIADAEQVKQYLTMMDGLADTMTLLHNHFFMEKAAQYKQMFKALVRRTKVCGVGYVDLGFQRILERDAEVTANVAKANEDIAHIEQMMAANAREPFEEESAKIEELRTTLAELQSKETLIVQEGPILAFPKSTRVIPDPACTHLKTWTGADWLALEFDFSPEQIEEIYKVDVRGSYLEYKADDAATKARWSTKEGEVCKEGKPGKVWRIQNRKTGTEFTICEGYHGYLKPPVAPDVKVSRFFTIYPLVFNEIEDEDEIFPPSDVWQARHTQMEMNRSKEGIREHRMQNRPAYLTSKGTFEPSDLQKFQNYASGEIIEISQALTAGDKIADKIQAKPSIPIDPVLYETESLYADMLHTVGSQAADEGATSGDTATEVSIAEHGRGASLADNVDDLDDLLSLVADGMGEVMLKELSKDTVIAIVGPGAVWPDMPQTREEIVEDITLDIRAGSSGRPNAAAELAKMERAMPMIIQLPNVNPVPITEKYLDLLDIDAEDAIIEGIPSITAVNQMMSAPPVQPPTGNPKTDPGQQGSKGGGNAPKGEGEAPQGQPAYPAPAPGPMV